jgi:undecaprenyl diphosphate synthase
MDGNGRWAAARNLPRLEGHRRGAERIFDVVDSCIDQGIKNLTIFAFSVENWKRPEEEVTGLFKLGEWVLRMNLARVLKRKVRLQVIGDLEAMPDFVKVPLKEAIQASASNDALNLVVALNYGSRQEVTLAAQRLAQDVASGKLKPEDVNWQSIESRLQTSGLPDPDLIIRTSGESRLSNFLLLQSAYSEIVIVKPHWPDFTKEEFQAALLEFSKRERRFGMTREQIQPTLKA